MQTWLFKSEPFKWSFDQQVAAGAKGTQWDGVRNYQARNYMSSMKKGDEVLFYHSSCDEPGVVGIARVVKEAYPDHTAFDPDDPHFDPKSRSDAPTWFMVDVKFVRKLRRTLGLAELKSVPALADFALVRKGNRLSVLPVTEAQWRAILALE
jgi:predicted RNA-binding protein with PUA-like domain